MSGPVGAEVVRAVYGAYRLAHFDASGLQWFNATVEGFWRSFLAAVIAAPASALLILIDWSLAAEAGETMAHGASHAALVEGLIYVIAWTAFPLAMHAVCEVAGWRERYIAYIVALNWANLFETAILLPIVAATAGGLLPAGLAIFVQIVVYGYIIAYEIFIARRSLQIGLLPAFAVVAFGFVLAIAVRDLGNGFL